MKNKKLLDIIKVILITVIPGGIPLYLGYQGIKYVKNKLNK